MDPNINLEAKRFIHQNLAALLDLRKISIGEIQSEGFRDKTRRLVEKKLSEHKTYSFLSAQPSFVQEVLDETLGLGPLETLIKNDDVSEIMVNGPDEIFIERSGKIEKTNLRFANETGRRNRIGRIVSPWGRRID